MWWRSLQRGKANANKDSQVAPDLVSKPGTEKDKADAAADTVSEPVLKPEIKAAAKPKTKGADGRREAAEARREAAKKARVAPLSMAVSVHMCSDVNKERTM